MTRIQGSLPEERYPRPERRPETVKRARLLGLILHHSVPSVILIASTLVLFRTWIGNMLPGGTDSPFLYSEMVFFKYHGLNVFTVWLPTPFGQVSQYSMYWLLSMLSTVFRSTLLTYKLAAISIALTSVFGMYAVSWSWTRSRLGALAAAIFYGFSPLSMAQWMTGHVNVQVSMALGPIMLWCIDRVLETGSKRAAVGLGLCGSALVLLTTGQGAYWILAIMVFVPVKFCVRWRNFAAMLWRGVIGALLAATVFVAASAVQLLPWASGARAVFAGGSGLAIESLNIHAKYSLGFVKGIAGIPWETWLPLGSNVSFVSFHSLLFIVPEIAIVAFASLAVLTRKGSFYIAFLIMAVAAWFVAAGPFGPMSSYYRYIWEHVVFFRELRVPNRWLMLSSFAVASMLAMSISTVRTWSMRRKTRSAAPGPDALYPHAFPKHASAGRARRRGGSWRAVKVLGHSLLLVVTAWSLLELNGGTILASGLPTIKPPPAAVSTYTALGRTPGDWRVLTIPFGQSWMEGPIYGDYEGIAADLGYTSALYNGRSVVSTGGWDRRASQFATFLQDLVNQGVDHHLAGLMGAVGIGYVVSNPEAAVLVPAGQANFLRSQQGLKLVSDANGMMVLENPLAQAQATQPASSCVIAGGYPVVEDLTEDPAFSFQTTAIYFADQVVSTSGWSGLERMIAASHCLILGPGGLGELTVLHDSAASAPATSVAPSQWQSGSIDPLLDSQGDPAYWVSIPPGQRLGWRTAAPSAGSYRVWLRIMREPGAAVVPVSVNGAPAGSVRPALSGTVGYQWLPAGVIHLDRGPVHVSLDGPGPGVAPQIAEIALVRSTGAQGALPAGVRPSWVIKDKDALDPKLLQKASVDWSHPFTAGPWHATPGTIAKQARRGIAVLKPAAAVREDFGLARVAIAGKINPRKPLAFEFQGSGKGKTFSLGFLFRDGSQTSYSFQDVTSRPRLLFFTPQQARYTRAPLVGRTPNQYFPAHTQQQVVPDWNQLIGITLSTSSHVWPGGTVRIGGPFAVKAPGLPHFAGSFPKAGSSGTMRGVRLIDPIVSFRASLQNVKSGILNFSQSYAPQWRLSGARSSVHTVAFGFENSYLVENGAERAVIAYQPATVGMRGTIISLAAWGIGLGILLIWPRGKDLFRRRRRRGPAGLETVGERWEF